MFLLVNPLNPPARRSRACNQSTATRFTEAFNSEGIKQSPVCSITKELTIPFYSVCPNILDRVAPVDIWHTKQRSVPCLNYNNCAIRRLQVYLKCWDLALLSKSYKSCKNQNISLILSPTPKFYFLVWAQFFMIQWACPSGGFLWTLWEMILLIFRECSEHSGSHFSSAHDPSFVFPCLAVFDHWAHLTIFCQAPDFQHEVIWFPLHRGTSSTSKGHIFYPGPLHSFYCVATLRSADQRLTQVPHTWYKLRGDRTVCVLFYFIYLYFFLGLLPSSGVITTNQVRMAFLTQPQTTDLAVLLVYFL